MLKPSLPELLWDLSFEGSEREGTCGLRVFRNEREMLRGGRRSMESLRVSLPIQWFSDEKAARSDPRSQPDRGRLEKQGRKLWEAMPPEAKAPCSAQPQTSPAASRSAPIPRPSTTCPGSGSTMAGRPLPCPRRCGWPARCRYRWLSRR